MSVEAATHSLGQWLAERRTQVEAALARLIPGPPESPAVLDAAVRYSLLGGGKRLRPLLVLAAAEAVSDDAATQALAVPAACAVELIHTYSLIHDDLPAMDDDSLRRGRPTSHVVFGEGMAILAGDGLLTEAFALLAREPQTSDPEIVRRKVDTIGAVATAAGIVGMVGGQAIDLHAARPHAATHATPFDAEALRHMHAMKTGALITASVVAGATMAGAADATREAIRAYGRELGLAFQIVDDVLDVEGTSTVLGKTAGKDAAAGKPTYPALFGLDRSKTLAREAVARATAAARDAALGGRLIAMADWVLTRTT